LEAAAKAAARSFYKYFIVLLLPEIINQYSVASIQWEAIEKKATTATSRAANIHQRKITKNFIPVLPVSKATTKHQN
jgi:hypothetical protein